MRDGQVCRV